MVNCGFARVLHEWCRSQSTKRIRLPGVGDRLPDLRNGWRSAWAANLANNRANHPYLVGDSLLETEPFRALLFHTALLRKEIRVHTPRFPSSCIFCPFPWKFARFLRIPLRWLP